jgi:hypothetical protein
MSALLHASFALLAACPQSRLPGVPVAEEEILAEMKSPLSTHAGRENALVALFKQGGAKDAEVRLLPLPDSVKPLVEKMRAGRLAQLAARGASQAEIDAATTALDKRCQSLGRTVMVEMSGRSDRVIGFAAHVDAAEGSPGVIDDWSGCVLLANLFQTLRSTRPRHTIWFLAFAEQELGCLGSGAWADALPPEQLEKIDAFVTVECAGVASPMAWWSGSQAGAVELAADAARRSAVPLQVVDFPGESSDSLRLRARGIPTLALIGIDPPHVRLLHGPEDRHEALDRRRVGEMYSLLRVLAAEFDEHMQPLRWDYVKEKLRLGDPASGRAPIQPVQLDLGASVPAPAPPAESPPVRDGSPP